MVQQGDAAADGREGVAREIEVRDRLKHEVRAVVAQGGQRVVLVQGQLVEADARHGLADELARVGAGQQKLREGLAVAGGHAATRRIKSTKRRRRLSLRANVSAARSVKIDDLHAAVAQHLRKAVMLCLRAAQVGNVVKQKALHRIGDELLQLRPNRCSRTFFSGRTSLLTSMAMPDRSSYQNF